MVVVFCCSSFYSFFSCPVCLFSFATFSTFFSRYYRSPVRVCCVRVTLHRFRTNPPSLSSVNQRRVETGNYREQSELTVMKEQTTMRFSFLSQTHGLSVRGPAAEDALSSASSRLNCSTSYHPASG